MNPCECLDTARHVALAAGRRILDIYERDVDVEIKADGSPLTAADVASEEVIRAGLADAFPDIPLLSEESSAVAYETRRAWKTFWLVDPLDGTKEFIERNGEFTVNIALIQDQRPVLGVVYVPVLGLMYSACRGAGAFRQTGECRPDVIRARPYTGGKPVVVTSRSHIDEATHAMLAAIGDHDVVNMGSSLKFCLVAAGSADVYPRLGPTMEWDTAAAHCIVEEAGGRVVGLDGQSLSYNKPDLHQPGFLVVGPGATDWRQFIPATK